MMSSKPKTTDDKIKFDCEKMLKHPEYPNTKVEGYWATSIEESKKPDQFPWPTEHKTEFPGKADFLKKLREIETSLKKMGRPPHFLDSLGWSDCRCCKKMNGGYEYSLNNVNWPEGYSHYIEKHNVVPSKEFFSFIWSQKPIPVPEREVFRFSESSPSPRATQQFFGFQDSPRAVSPKESQFSFGDDLLELKKSNP